MPFVSEELIEKTWRRIGAFVGREIIKLQKEHRKDQNPLTMFVYAIATSYREDAAGLAIYVYHVVLEAFRRTQPRPKKVAKRQIEALSEQFTSDVPFDLNSALTASSEPHVLRYAYEAFTEDDDEVALSDYELESFLQLLQIVIECLHRACQRR